LSPAEAITWFFGYVHPDSEAAESSAPGGAPIMIPRLQS
jgi:hypothetical protein